MKHPSTTLIAAAICSTWISAAAEEPLKSELNFQEPRFNVVDDLSDYGGDHSWPVSSTSPDRTDTVNSKSAPEPTVQERMVVDVDFTGDQFNTVDDLSDYGGDHRWPVTGQGTESIGDDLASSDKAED